MSTSVFVRITLAHVRRYGMDQTEARVETAPHAEGPWHVAHVARRWSLEGAGRAAQAWAHDKLGVELSLR